MNKNQVLQTFEELGIDSTVYPKIDFIFQTLPSSKIIDVQSKFRKYSLIQFVSGGWKDFDNFFNIKPDKTGYGDGEIQCLMALKNSFLLKRENGKDKGDIEIEGKNVEIKKLAGRNLRIGEKGGSIFSTSIPFTITKFYSLLENQITKVDILNIINDYFLNSKAITSVKNFNTINARILSDWYLGFKALNSLNFYRNRENSTQLSIDNKKYWISKDNIDKIKVNSKVEIYIGNECKIEEEIMRHEYVINPDKFILPFLDIVDNYIRQFDYLLIFSENGKLLELLSKTNYNSKLIVDRIGLGFFQLKYITENSKDELSFHKRQKELSHELRDR